MESKEPYPGLRSFQRHEVDIFFGRDSQIDDMIAKLAATRFLCITGPSGCGKSSLARTGLMNGLEAGFLRGSGSNWIFVDMRPGSDPLTTLLHAIANAIETPDGNGDQARPKNRNSEIIQLLDNHVSHNSLDLTGALALIADLADHPILILVDQFEELFRYAQVDPHAASAFVNVLLQTVAAKNNVYVAITIRTDELEKCSRYPGLTAMVNDSQFLTPTLDRFEIQEAIEGPIGLFGGSIDSEFTVWLLNSIEDEVDKLPLLQHTLKILYRIKCQERAANFGGANSELPPISIRLRDLTNLLTPEDVQGSAGSQGGTLLRRLLAHRLDTLYFSLPERLQRGVQRTFCALTASETGRRDIRRIVALDTLAETINYTPNDTRSIVQAFADGDDSYLVVSASPKNPDEPTVDVTHECVLRLWDRLSNEWLPIERRGADNIRFLQQLAQNHKAANGTTSLINRLIGGNTIQGGTLQRYQQWFRQSQPTKTWAARYLDPISSDLSANKDAARSSLQFEEIVRFLLICERRENARKFLYAAAAITATVSLFFVALKYKTQQESIAIQEEFARELISDAMIKAATEVTSLDKDTRIIGPDNRCTDPTFCTALAQARQATISFSQALTTRLCPADSLYKGLESISNFKDSECSQFPPVTNTTTLVPNFGGQIGTLVDLTKAISSSESEIRPLARTILLQLARKYPNLATAFRNLGVNYLDDPKMSERKRFGEATACLKRAVDLSCQNPSYISEMYFSGYAMSMLFDRFQLPQQKLLLLSSLSTSILDQSATPDRSYPTRHIERLWRSAEPATDTARIIGKTYGCFPSLFGPESSNDSRRDETACESAKDFYVRAARTWVQVLEIAKAPNLTANERTQIAYAMGYLGLFWGQDSEFRRVLRRLIDPKQLFAELAKAAELRQLPRYYAGLAMFSCLERDFDSAGRYERRIPSQEAKYIGIKNKVKSCAQSTDLENYFNEPVISK